MSFADKLTSLMVRPNQQTQQAPDEIPWTLKYGGRILGTVGAFFAILFGFWMTLSIVLGGTSCFLGGIIQIAAGCVVLICEAPCCLICIESVQDISDRVDARPHWNKAAVYCGMAVVPIFLCPGLGSVFGAGLIFATGVIYGMIAIGKKASAEEMRNSAAASNFNAPPPGAASRVTSQPSSGMRSNLVDNAAPISFTGVPVI